MYNLLKNLMIMRSLSAVAAVFMVTLLSPLALFAADIPWTPGGGVDKIKVTGDCTWEWVGDELVIKWLSGSGTMELPGKADFRALLVGGGGAGGRGGNSWDYWYAGGGGGAGQVLEIDTSKYESGKYQIVVGAGGEPTPGKGGKGQPSSITFGDMSTVALGGGGGGSQSSAADGGEDVAGGGGAGGDGNGQLGGVGSVSTGGASAGEYDEQAGGGGGAGSDGSDATLSNAGKGGAGLTSDISGGSVTYGGAGGGGTGREDFKCT